MKNTVILIVALFSVQLVGCSESTDPELSVSADGSSDLQLLPPPLLISSRMIGPDSLFAEITLSYSDVSTSFTAEKVANTDHWNAQLQVPTQTAFTINITWFDLIDQQRLDLVSSSNSFQPFNYAGEITISRNFANFDKSNFDADSDSIDNLTERLNGTSPFDASSPTLSPSSDPASNSTGFTSIACWESYPRDACELHRDLNSQNSINGITESVTNHPNGSCDALVPEPRTVFLVLDGTPEIVTPNWIQDFTGHFSLGGTTDYVSCLTVTSNSN